VQGEEVEHDLQVKAALAPHGHGLRRAVLFMSFAITAGAGWWGIHRLT
jgi:hypothetical protein